MSDSDESRLDLSLFQDACYTWNDDLTENMSSSDKICYLVGEAEQMMELMEYEVAYGILRELVVLEPRLSNDCWLRLKTCCEALGYHEQARAAAANARALEQ